MTPRLSLCVSVSLLAHLAVLMTWRAAPTPTMMTRQSLQVSLAQGMPPAAAVTATPRPTPATPPAKHNTTTAHPRTTARHYHMPRPALMPVTAQPAPATPVAMTLAATAPSAAQPLDPALADAAAARLQDQVRRALARYFNYPALARRYGWEGVVRLSLHLEPDGQLSAVHLIQSSGHSALDAAALASAQRIPPLPEAVIWLHGSPHEMLLPVEYRLIGG